MCLLQMSVAGVFFVIGNYSVMGNYCEIYCVLCFLWYNKVLQKLVAISPDIYYNNVTQKLSKLLQCIFT